MVNIGSLVGARDEPYVTAYACAKAASFRLTGTLAAETAGHGIIVLCVSPGLVRTRMVEESILGAAGGLRTTSPRCRDGGVGLPL